MTLTFRDERDERCQRDEIDKQVNDLLDKNYIAPSRSTYAYPIVPVLKKDGSIRLCVDYRKLTLS